MFGALTAFALIATLMASAHGLRTAGLQTPELQGSGAEVVEPFSAELGSISQTCWGFCDALSGSVLCRTSCLGIDTGICYGSDYVLCKGGCAMSLWAYSDCVKKCEHDLVEPCKQKLIHECYDKCDNTIVKPCENDCEAKAFNGCKNVVGGIFQSGNFGSDEAFCVLVSTGIGAASAELGPGALLVKGLVKGACKVAVRQAEAHTHCKEHPWQCAETFCHALGL